MPKLSPKKEPEEATIKPEEQPDIVPHTPPKDKESVVNEPIQITEG